MAYDLRPSLLVHLWKDPAERTEPGEIADQLLSGKVHETPIGWMSISDQPLSARMR